MPPVIALSLSCRRRLCDNARTVSGQLLFAGVVIEGGAGGTLGKMELSQY
jgi:hypothetical protein